MLDTPLYIGFGVAAAEQAARGVIAVSYTHLFGSAVPRAANASGGGQPGTIVKCKGWETDPNAYLYFIAQAPVWKAICQVIGKQEWITDPNFATPEARLPRLTQVFATVELSLIHI